MDIIAGVRIRAAIKAMLSSMVLMTSGLVIVAMTYYHFYVPDGAYVSGDSRLFLAVAEDIQSSGLSRVHDVVPLYPVLLAILGISNTNANMDLVYAANSVLYIITVLVLQKLGMLVGASLRQRALLYVISILPISWEVAMYVMPEVLTQMLLVLSVYLLVKFVNTNSTHLAFTGILTAVMAGLARASHQWIGVVLSLLVGLAYIVFQNPQPFRVGIARSAGLLAVAVVLSLSFPIYNLICHGYLGSTYFAGYAMTMNTALFIERMPPNYDNVRKILIDARDAALVKPHSEHSAVSYIHSARVQLKQELAMDDVQLGAYLLDMNVQLIKSAPLQYLSAVIKSMALFWSPQGMGGMTNKASKYYQGLWTAVYAVVIGMFAWVTVIIMGSAARAMAGPESTAPDVLNVSHVALFMSYVVILYTWFLSSLVAGVTARYRTPVEPLMFFVICTNTQWFRIRKPAVVVNNKHGEPSV